MGVRMVLWDFDGTLADSRRDVWRSLIYAASREGGCFSDAFMGDPGNLSTSMENIFSHVNPYPGSDRLEDFIETVNTHYRTMNKFSDTSFYPGVEDLLGELRSRGTGSIIVTLKPHIALERLLADKGWGQMFTGWVAPDSSSTGEKSKTDMVAAVLEGWHLTPQTCLMIGDSQGDIQAAKANDIRSVAVTYGDGNVAPLLAANPTYIAHSVSDLESILKKAVWHVSRFQYLYQHEIHIWP